MTYFIGVTVTQILGQWFAYTPERVLGPFTSERAAWHAVRQEAM
jgi:hypothetical protein